MKQGDAPPFWVIFGVVVVVAATLGFLLVSLEGRARSVEPAITQPLASRPAVATVPTTKTSIPTLTPATSPLVQLVPEPPTMSPPQVPEIAPDFTLDRAGGYTLTLSEQLTRGPVALVLMQSGGG